MVTMHMCVAANYFVVSGSLIDAKLHGAILLGLCMLCFFFSSRRRHTRYWRDWSSDVCSSDLAVIPQHERDEARVARSCPPWASSRATRASSRSCCGITATHRCSGGGDRPQAFPLDRKSVV